MTISKSDIAEAKRLCATFQPHYRGPNPVSAGRGAEDDAQRQVDIDEAWTAWSGFARNYFMAMLNTIAGCKPVALESEIVRFCSPAEALGGRAAMDVFWRRGLTMKGPVTRYGGVAMTPIQYAIIADEAVNAEVFTDVERMMETEMLNILRARRGMLQEIDEAVDHRELVEEDVAFIFGAGRPARLSPAQRNENFHNALF